MKEKKFIKFTGKQLEEFADNCGEHPDFSGFEFSTDTDEGHYDSSKSSMVDYPMYMRDSNTEEYYSTTGGY